LVCPGLKMPSDLEHRERPGGETARRLSVDLHYSVPASREIQAGPTWRSPCPLRLIVRRAEEGDMSRGWAFLVGQPPLSRRERK
jgi:hypothetical protein